MSGRPYTTVDLAYMRQHYPTGDVRAIAAHLGRPVHSIRELARRHGLSRASQVGTYTLEAVQSRCQIDEYEGDDACWVWQGCIKAGIPHAYHGGKLRSMRRVVWEMHHDKPAGKRQVIRPKCGCQHCLNPEHLKAYSREKLLRENQNSWAPAARSAQARAQAKATGLAKLDEGKALQILLSNAPSKELAARYGVTTKTINSVRRGASWACVHLGAG